MTAIRQGRRVSLMGMDEAVTYLRTDATDQAENDQPSRERARIVEGACHGRGQGSKTQKGCKQSRTPQPWWPLCTRTWQTFRVESPPVAETGQPAETE